MKSKLFIITLILFFFSLPLISPVLSAEENKVHIRIAYPAVGTLINGQIGQIFERTDVLSRNGLEGEVIAFQYGPPMMEALLSGKVDVALTSEQNVVLLLGKGFPSRVIAGLGSAGRAGLMVRVDSDIKSIKDLKGKKITTIFGSSVHRPIIVWLGESDLFQGRDVELINMSGGESRTALLDGSVDAVMSWDPYVEDFIQKNQARAIKTQPLQLAVIMSEEFINKNPDAAVNFLMALKEAAFYLAVNKKEVNNWYSQISRLDIGLIDRCSLFNKNYKAETFNNVNIDMDEDFIKTLEAIADFLFKEQLISRKVDIKKGVNAELLKKADEKLKEIEYDPSQITVTKPSQEKSVSW